MKQLFIFVFLMSFISLSAQRVGVNVTSPEFTLDVRSPSIAEPGQFNISNLDKSKYLRFYSGSDAYPDPSMSWSPGYSFLFATFDDATLNFTEYMRISSLGNVGIGISNPEANLDLKGGAWNLDAGIPGDLRIGSSSFNLRFGVAIGGGGAGISRIYSSSHLIFGVADDPIMMIESGGETGFGTTNPSQRVHINGKLKIGDDAKAPTEGTIRYNSANNSFEGYDGTKWINLGGSSPYGVQGTFNLPNTSFNPNMPGNSYSMTAAQDLIVIKSKETVQTGTQTFFPFDPIYGDKVYVQLFQKNGSSNWENVLSLDQVAPALSNTYGASIAVSENRLLIGDPINKTVIEYTYDSEFWLETKIFNSPVSSIDDFFGSSVAIYGDMTIIGAPADGFLNGPNGPGKAYIYDASDNFETTLSGPGAELGDLFGSSVDLTNNRAIVGAPGDKYGSLDNAGSATIFNKFSGNWSTNSTHRDQTIEADEKYGAGVTIEDSDYFFIIGGNEGIDAYLIEGGYWVLKETITGQGSNYSASYSRHLGFDKMVFYNNSSDVDEIDYIIAAERDVNNYFVNTSSLINGTTKISSFDIVTNEIYTLGSDGKIYIFEN